MSRAGRSHESQHRRIVLLAGQAFALGLMMAWILIPASAIFLATYGPGLLPMTYIGAAVVGVVSSKSLAAAFRKRPVASVAMKLLAGFCFLLLASWLVLWRWHADWVSFCLLVLVPIVVPIGFIFVVGQAGILLDVRALKALYARVVAGFALGFMAGGVAGPPLLAALGRTEHLLAAAAVAAGIFLILLAMTWRAFPGELSIVEHGDLDAERVTLRVLLHHRYVVLIVAFQMLSAVESQWLDFLVFDRAAGRYADSRDLARFISRFSAIAYGADIVFLLVLAGILLRRFGLRYGLAANATGVLALIGTMIVAASLEGSGATVVFVLIVAARVTDLVFSDGSSRTSLSAAYQVVPNRLRLAAQATTEGLAVPVAIGLSGLVLLAVRAAGKIDGSLLAWLTGTVVAAWAVIAMLLYREYRVNLLASLRQRTLSPAELTVDVTNNLAVIDRLIESEHERDVRLGLDILATAEHPGLPARLQRLVGDGRVAVRINAFERLARLNPHKAATAARIALDDPSGSVRAACIRVIAPVADTADVAAIAAHSTDPAPEVKAAVAATLIHIDDDMLRAPIAAEISRLSSSESSHDRTTAAEMLGECEPGSRIDRSTLQTLLADPDLDVVNAALAAIRWPDDAALLADIAGHLGTRRTAHAAVDALGRGSSEVLEFADDVLRTNELARHPQQLLARVCRTIGSGYAVEVLRRHVEHPDREIGLAVLMALAALDPSSPSPDSVPPGENRRERACKESPVVRADLEHGTHVLHALVALDQQPRALLLRAALRDELELVRLRVLADLSIRYGSERLNRIAFQFAQPDSRSHALALEWFDVTLTGSDRAVVAILDPELSDRERMNTLTQRFPIAPMNPLEALLELIEDRDGRWQRPWIKACTLYAASGMPKVDLDVIVAAADVTSAAPGAGDGSGVVDETLAAIRRRVELDP